MGWKIPSWVSQRKAPVVEKWCLKWERQGRK
uniref:Uncharacterized protein n=1 Tax=Rhizophora mucronata TaxID=61149 RepID=A0A2P2MS08_RHIMU